MIGNLNFAVDITDLEGAALDGRWREKKRANEMKRKFYLSPSMKFFMSLTIIIPRERLPTLTTLKRPLPSMTPQMAP